MLASRFVLIAMIVVHACIPEYARAQAKKVDLPPMFANRDAAKRLEKVRAGEPNQTEQAIDLGLKYLVDRQSEDGHWTSFGGEELHIAATAFGLLPFLAVGYTHKASDSNPYDKTVSKGLKYLMQHQSRKTGYFGDSMYSHGLATIALCEAYAMTKDPDLRTPAQYAVQLLVQTQDDKGGWRYQPEKKPGDLSITGWQAMALKTAIVAGLDVPNPTITRVKFFVGSTVKNDSGYCYMPTGFEKSSPTMTAVGMLCRQHLDRIGPNDPRFTGALKHLTSNPPDGPDCYYRYYATQVMYNAGGPAWAKWKAQANTAICKAQDTKPTSSTVGSWSPEGEKYGRSGGRTMVTSLNLLTLAIEYRYTPLFEKKAK